MSIPIFHHNSFINLTPFVLFILKHKVSTYFPRSYVCKAARVSFHCLTNACALHYKLGAHLSIACRRHRCSFALVRCRPRDLPEERFENFLIHYMMQSKGDNSYIIQMWHYSISGLRVKYLVNRLSGTHTQVFYLFIFFFLFLFIYYYYFFFFSQRNLCATKMLRVTPRASRESQTTCSTQGVINNMVLYRYSL